MSDLISREALIEEVKRTVDMQDVYLPIIFIDIARNMSTVKTEQWIPCSERLPNKNGVYQITRKVFEGESTFYIADCAYFDGQNTWHNDNRVNFARPWLNDVIAWMPLPEPYKGE